MANSIRSLAKMGFGLGLGVMAAQVVFLLIGLAFFLPGLMLVRTGKREDNKDASYYGGIALMVVGIALMGGFGIGALVDGLDF